MVGYVREITAKKSRKCDKYGSFEHLLLLLQTRIQRKTSFGFKSFYVISPHPMRTCAKASALDLADNTRSTALFSGFIKKETNTVKCTYFSPLGIGKMSYLFIYLFIYLFFFFLRRSHLYCKSERSNGTTSMLRITLSLSAFLRVRQFSA